MVQPRYVSLQPFTIALVSVIGINGAVLLAGLFGAALPGVLGWLPIVVTLVASSAWVYRTHSNARALGATDLRFSPVSAALLIIIPFANIYASRMIYQELWMRCTGKPEQPSPLILWWWRILMFGILLTLALSFASAFQPALATPAVVWSSLYPFATLGLYVLFVLRISKRQQAARTRQLALSDAAAPAPAPAGAVPRVSLMNLEGIIGITLVLLLMVGVPAFLTTLKYEKRTKRNTLALRLDQLSKTAKMLRANGALPDSVGPTPPLGTCCSDPGAMCRPDPTWWEHPTWRALEFSIDEPHIESYELVREGDDFRVIAHQDADCDTTYARFELSSTGGQIVEENPRE